MTSQAALGILLTRPKADDQGLELGCWPLSPLSPFQKHHTDILDVLELAVLRIAAVWCLPLCCCWPAVQVIGCSPQYHNSCGQSQDGPDMQQQTAPKTPSQGCQVRHRPAAAQCSGYCSTGTVAGAALHQQQQQEQLARHTTAPNTFVLDDVGFGKSCGLPDATAAGDACQHSTPRAM